MFQPNDEATFYQIGLSPANKVLVAIYDVKGNRIDSFEPVDRKHLLDFLEIVAERLFLIASVKESSR